MNYLCCHSEPQAKNPVDSMGFFASLRMTILFIVVFVVSLLMADISYASELDPGWELLGLGNKAGAAEFFNRYTEANPASAATTPEALAICGRILDSLADSLTGEAEKRCYWVKKSTSPECMQKETAALNGRFGAGSFVYEPGINYISYTGMHYRKLKDKFPKSEYSGEAAFYFLLKELVGQPETVFAKAKAWLSKNPKGQWNRKGMLLWARLNQDMWYITRTRSVLTQNDQLASEELVVKAEPYRKEALKAYEQLMSDKNTFEAVAARRECDLLKANQDDGVIYGIVGDATTGTLAIWGIDVPQVFSAPSEIEAPKQPVEEKAPPKVEQQEKKPKKSEQGMPSKWE